MAPARACAAPCMHHARECRIVLCGEEAQRTDGDAETQRTRLRDEGDPGFGASWLARLLAKTFMVFSVSLLAYTAMAAGRKPFPQLSVHARRCPVARRVEPFRTPPRRARVRYRSPHHLPTLRSGRRASSAPSEAVARLSRCFRSRTTNSLPIRIPCTSLVSGSGLPRAPRARAPARTTPWHKPRAPVVSCTPATDPIAVAERCDAARRGAGARMKQSAPSLNPFCHAVLSANCRSVPSYGEGTWAHHERIPHLALVH